MKSCIENVSTNLCSSDLRPYYTSKLELKSNSSEILPVNCKFISDSIST